MSKFKFLSAISVAAFVTASPALAADDLDAQQFEERFSSSAVSALNAKIEVGKFHSSFDENGFGPLALEEAEGYFVQGAVSAPLFGQFGLQIDAGQMDGDADVNFFGNNADLNARAIAAHLFWRDPSKGLLGVYGVSAEYDIEGFEIDNKRFGVEGEAYIDRFTLKGFVGRDFVDYELFGKEEYAAASAKVDYYISDNFVIGAGIDHSFEQTAFNVGFEMMGDTGGISPSIFTDVSFNNGETTLMAGLKLYLAKDGKSLIRRHREDDPGIELFDNISSLGNCVAGFGKVELHRSRPAMATTLAKTRISLEPSYDLEGCKGSMSYGIRGGDG